MQLDVQSIKWISCKGMYKGYRLADMNIVASQQPNFVISWTISSEKIWLCFSQPKNCRGIHYQRKIFLCKLYRCYSQGHVFFFWRKHQCFPFTVMFFFPLWPSFLSMITPHSQYITVSLVSFHLLQSCVNPQRDFNHTVFHHTDCSAVFQTIWQYLILHLGPNTMYVYMYSCNNFSSSSTFLIISLLCLPLPEADREADELW